MLWYPYSLYSRKNPTSYLRKGLYRPVHKKLTEGKCAYVQGQTFYNAAQRNIRLPIFLTRLSDETQKRRGLCIFLTSLNPTTKAAGSEALLKAVSRKVRSLYIIQKLRLAMKSSKRAPGFKFYFVTLAHTVFQRVRVGSHTIPRFAHETKCKI